MSEAATVRLRSLTRGEQVTLRSKLRQVSLPARLHRRYRVIALVRAGHTIAESGSRAGLNLNSAYLWVHRFNASGLRDFERPNNPRGRIPILTSKQLRELIDVALSSPAEYGLPFTSWSVRTLTEYCRKHDLIPEFCDEWVRRVLRREGLTAQRIRTWKTSSDPKFGPKGRIRSLYEHRPPRSAVVCLGEWGPLELRPIGGRSWARRGEPVRMPATYHRHGGTETFLGFYDVHQDVLAGIFRKRKRVREVGEAFRRLRACYPHRRLYVVLDNLRLVHDHPRFLALCRRLRINLVFTPTEASWLNLIEPHFGVLHRATVAGSDDREHVVRRRRIYRYLRLRHRKLGNAAHPLTRIRAVKPVKLERH